MSHKINSEGMTTCVLPPMVANAANSPWLTKKQAAAYLAVNPKTVERRGVLWTDKTPPRPGIRFRRLIGDGPKTYPRYWRPDVEANCFADIHQSRPRH